MGQIANQMAIDALFKLIQQYKNKMKDAKLNKENAEKNKQNKNFDDK